MSLNRRRGFTLLELVIALAILSIVVTMAVPVLKLQAQREKEAELRVALRDIRNAIDAYKRAVDEGRVKKSLGATGYPPSLEVLAGGVRDERSPKAAPIYFLRRLPRDPMSTEPELPAAQTWALRSYASPPDDPREGEDVYDVASRSPRVGLDGVPYRKW